MIFLYDMNTMPECTRFGRMLQRNQWNRQGVTQKNVNLLVYVVSGEAVFTIAGTPLQLRDGDALLIPANTPYSADTGEFCDYYFFHFTGEIVPVENPEPYTAMLKAFSFDLPSVCNRRITLMQITQTADRNAKFYSYIMDCEDLHNSATFSGRLAIDYLLCRLLLLLSQIAEDRNSASNYPLVLEKMLGFIRKNLTNSLSVAELCAYCGVSESYAARIFKKFLNTTITQYYTDQKLNYACELLLNTGMNVSQIAAYLGFCDVYYFSRRFKEKYGKSPTKMFSQESI